MPLQRVVATSVAMAAFAGAVECHVWGGRAALLDAAAVTVTAAFHDHGVGQPVVTRRRMRSCHPASIWWLLPKFCSFGSRFVRVRS